MPLGYNMRQPGDDITERLSSALKAFFALMSDRGGSIESRMRDTTMQPQSSLLERPQRPQQTGGGGGGAPGGGGGGGLPDTGETTDVATPGFTPRHQRNQITTQDGRSYGLLSEDSPVGGKFGEYTGGGFVTADPQGAASNRALNDMYRQQMARDSLAGAASYWGTLAMQTGNPRHILAANQAAEAYNQYQAAEAEKMKATAGTNMLDRQLELINMLPEEERPLAIKQMFYSMRGF